MFIIAYVDFFRAMPIIVLMYMEEPVLAEAPGADVARPSVSPNVEVVLAIASNKVVKRCECSSLLRSRSKP